MNCSIYLIIHFRYVNLPSAITLTYYHVFLKSYEKVKINIYCIDLLKNELQSSVMGLTYSKHQESVQRIGYSFTWW